MTVERWWSIVDKSWSDLVNVVEKFHVAHQNQEQMMNFPITAGLAEKACESVRSAIKTDSPITIIEKAKEDRDIAILYKILSETWFSAPESRSVFNVAGFGIVCDLLDDMPEDDDNERN